MYFIIFQPKNILKLYLNFNESQPYMLINVRLMKKRVYVIYCMSFIRDRPFGTYTSTLISPSHKTEQQKLFTTARFIFKTNFDI